MVSYLIWYSDDSDGVVVEGDGSVPTFRHTSALAAYAGGRGWSFDEEESGGCDHDFDAVEHWLNAPDDSAIDCCLFLNAWNLFDDLASSTGGVFLWYASQEASDVYDKLFWGSNVPAVTPPGERHDPTWSEDEVDDMRRVLSAGMAMFRGVTREMV